MIDYLFDKTIEWLEVQRDRFDNPPFLDWLYWFLADTQEYLHRLWWSKLMIPHRLEFLGEHNPYYGEILELEDLSDLLDSDRYYN